MFFRASVRARMEEEQQQLITGFLAARGDPKKVQEIISRNSSASQPPAFDDQKREWMRLKKRFEGLK